MTRRSKRLLAFGCIAATVSFLFLSPVREDDLDWIRRYGPVEQVRRGAPGDFGRGRFATRWHIFKFESIPAGFLAELRRRTEYHASGDSYHFNGTFPDTDRIMLSTDSKTVEVWMHEKESWVDRSQRQLKGLVCLK